MKNVAVLATGIVCLVACGSPEAESPNSETYVQDVAFLGDSVILSERNGYFHISHDLGKTWKKARDKFPCNELMVGPNKRIWAVHGWAGIHEPSMGSFAYSDDHGETWKVIKSDPTQCIPVSFISSSGEEPIVLSADGGIWAHRPGQPESLDCWNRVVPGNPDEDAGSGTYAKGTYYVTSGRRVWMKPPSGNWKGSPFQFAVVTSDDRYCWLVERGGDVYRTPLGTEEWKLVASVPELAMPKRVLFRKGRLYVAGEGTRSNAYALILESSGEVLPMEGLEGLQSYSIRADNSGRVWVAAKGLYAQDPRLARWELIWSAGKSKD
jgi:hypothetical protein